MLRPTHTVPRLLLPFALLIVLGSSSLHASGGFVQGFPGATCKPSNQFDETYYEYVDHRLVNTGEGLWDIFIAVCPFSEVVRGAGVEELRILLKDEAENDAWCALLDQLGEQLDLKFLEFSGGEAFASFEPEHWAATEGLLEGTFHCLLQPGASVERIEAIWFEE